MCSGRGSGDVWRASAGLPYLSEDLFIGPARLAFGRWLLEREPIYAPLWGPPELQAMTAALEAGMAAQLERVREMERGGELEAIPRDERSSEQEVRPR